tara:strand:- start:5454 stop:5870 length:417 start_codon:yes stop_codon:yes gene_type:complete
MISEVLGTAQKETPMELQDVLGQLRALANSGLPLDSEVIKRAAGEIERLCVTADGVPAVDGMQVYCPPYRSGRIVSGTVYGTDVGAYFVDMGNNRAGSCVGDYYSSREAALESGNFIEVHPPLHGTAAKQRLEHEISE